MEKATTLAVLGEVVDREERERELVRRLNDFDLCGIAGGGDRLALHAQRELARRECEERGVGRFVVRVRAWQEVVRIDHERANLVPLSLRPYVLGGEEVPA